MIHLLLTAQLAMAQETVPSTDEPASISEESIREAEARLLLDLAQRRISTGQTELARELLEELLATYEDTSVAASARMALAPLVASAEDATATEGLVHLAISQALIGGITGALIPITLDIQADDATPYVVSALAGMGAGIGGSYLYTRNNTITRGEAWTFALGEGLGLYHGSLIAVAADMDSNTAIGGTLLLSEIAGGVAGAMIASNRSPSISDVSLVSAGASWGALNSIFLLNLIDPEPDAIFPLQVIITDAGLVTGILLARAHDLSPRRLSLINSAGSAGLGVGLLIGLLVDDDAPNSATILLGEAAGLTLGALSTRSMQAKYEGRIVMSAPQLKLHPEKDGSRSVEVSLLNGRF
ncbi:MAG: hypothetical protein ACI8RZ_007358 [Myxococcota bacterium]|jgi:hypothetical protein